MADSGQGFDTRTSDITSIMKRQESLTLIHGFSAKMHYEEAASPQIYLGLYAK